MDEQILLKAALIFSFIGIILLYVIAGTRNIKDISIEKITKEDAGSTVKISGKINEVDFREKITILDISQEKTIKVLLFNNEINFSKGSTVELKGKIDTDGGDYQVIADSVKVIS